jgi:hypothetical protein
MIGKRCEVLPLLKEDMPSTSTFLKAKDVRKRRATKRTPTLNKETQIRVVEEEVGVRGVEVADNPLFTVRWVLMELDLWRRLQVLRIIRILILLYEMLSCLGISAMVMTVGKMVKRLHQTLRSNVLL